MESFSKKEFLSLKMPTEEVPVSDGKRIELALNTLGYEPIFFPLQTLAKLYPLCRNANFDITVTLVHREYDWVVIDIEAGVTERDIHKLYLSGAFPAHSDLESAIAIGIFPDLPREKYALKKNSSLEGARILLLDHARLQEAKALAENIYCIQFASYPDFLVRMQAAKFIPHTDMEKFPSQKNI